MKQFLICLFGIALLATGCMKEKSQEQELDNDFFVRFKVGNTVKEYRNTVLALRSTNGNLNTVSIQGQESNDAATARLGIAITQSDPVVAGTYAEDGVSESPAVLYREGGKDYSNLYMVTPSGLSVTIQRINETTIRGTFNGSVSDLDGNVQEITEGAFYAKFQ